VKFGVGLTGGSPSRETAKFSKLAEDSGIEYVWIADENPAAPYRDVFVTLAAVAMETKKVKIGTGICNPYSRHPALLSVAIATLDELSGGRAILGLGAGGSLSLTPLGIRMWDRPLTAIKESVLACRRLLNGEDVDYSGEIVKILGARLFGPTRSVPIYLGAYGPKMLQLTGEIADGGLISSPLEFLPETLDRIREGSIRAGRDPREVDVANWLPFAVSEDTEEAMNLVKGDVCYMVADSPKSMLKEVEISEEEALQIKESLRKGDGSAKALVGERMVKSYAIAGTPEHCVQRIRDFINAGVTQIVLGAPFGIHPEDSMKMIREKILPAFD
jgi:5,10-methylenetetrahydromethanopterin reductase